MRPKGKSFSDDLTLAAGDEVLPFGGVVGLGGLGLDHDGGVAALVVLGLVGDRPDDVTTVEADGSAKGCECGNKHRHDDADNFDIWFHFFGSFRLTLQK